MQHHEHPVSRRTRLPELILDPGPVRYPGRCTSWGRETVTKIAQARIAQARIARIRTDLLLRC
eukprot:6458665-Amphidinium_carterae.1